MTDDLKERLQAAADGPLLCAHKPRPWVQRDKFGNVVRGGYELPDPPIKKDTLRP